MSQAPLFVAFSLLVAAGPAASQAPKPAPAEERSTAPGAGLNLKLDHPADYARETPRDGGGSAGALPAVGADARPLPAASPTPTATPPFPKDTERGER